MLLSTLGLLTFIYGAWCCESTTFVNTPAKISGRYGENPIEVTLSNCLGYNDQTKTYIHMEVTNQNIERIQNNTFANVPIVSISLVNNTIKEVEKGSFYRLMKLEKLDLSKNRIEKVQTDVFNGLISIHTLILSDNEIEIIEDLAFAYLPKLTELKLDNNKIKSWNMQWFTSNDRLHTINMENNLLDIIEDQSFTNLPALSTLVLRGNRLKDIEPKAFKGLTNLRVLDLSENNLRKLHKDLLAPTVGRKLTNNTGGFPGPSFLPFVGLWNLYIHRNNLTYLPDEIMNDLKRKNGFGVVTLYSNPWQCSCYQKITTWVDANHLTFNYWGKGCRHSDNPVCIVPENSPDCVEDVNEDIRSKFYAKYKHYTFYDGTDPKVHCVPI